MKQPFFYIPFRWLPFVMLCLTFAILQPVVLRALIPLPYGVLWLKSAVDALIMGGMGMLLTVAISSFHYARLDQYQRTVNYVALGIMYLIGWSLLSYFFSLLIFGLAQKRVVTSLIPFTTLVALLVYLVHLQLIHYRMVQTGSEDENRENMGGNPVSDLSGLDAEHNSALHNDREVLERVAVKSGQKIHVILVPDIVYIQSDGDYVQIITGQSRYLKEETMKYFEASLPRNRFVRVHRSYIVNVEKILRIELYEKQNQMLTLNNGDQIRASVAGYRELRTILNL